MLANVIGYTVICDSYDIKLLIKGRSQGASTKNYLLKIVIRATKCDV